MVHAVQIPKSMKSIQLTNSLLLDGLVLVPATIKAGRCGQDSPHLTKGVPLEWGRTVPGWDKGALREGCGPGQSVGGHGDVDGDPPPEEASYSSRAAGHWSTNQRIERRSGREVGGEIGRAHV